MQCYVNRIKPTAVVERLLPEDVYLQWEDESKGASVSDTSDGKDHTGPAASTEEDTPEDALCGSTEVLSTCSEVEEKPESDTLQSAHIAGAAPILPPS
jgi:hypothetical protein